MTSSPSKPVILIGQNLSEGWKMVYSAISMAPYMWVDDLHSSEQYKKWIARAQAAPEWKSPVPVFSTSELTLLKKAPDEHKSLVFQAKNAFPGSKVIRHE